MLTAEKRRELQNLERQVAAIRAKDRAPAKAKHRAERKAREAALTGAHGQRAPIHREAAYPGWIHDQGLPCVACAAGDIIPAGLANNRIEAAHQWTIRGAMKGRKTDDWTCVPLCRWHHQDAPNACDKGQRKFWERFEIDIEALARGLFGAYRGGSSGHAVIQNAITSRGSAERVAAGSGGEAGAPGGTP